MPCGISDLHLPSFLQERFGFLNTDRWSDPDCCDRLSIFGRLDRESCHLAPLLKTTLVPPRSGQLPPATRLLRRGAWRSSLIEGPRCPMLEEFHQHSARHEIKEFLGALLSSRPIRVAPA
jgi:hypothetical protein